MFYQGKSRRGFVTWSQGLEVGLGVEATASQFLAQQEDRVFQQSAVLENGVGCFQRK